MLGIYNFNEGMVAKDWQDMKIVIPQQQVKIVEHFFMAVC